MNPTEDNQDAFQKLKQLIKLAVIVIFTGVALTACLDVDDDDEDDVTEEDIEEFQTTILGTWDTNCRDETAQGNSFSASISRFVITMNGITNSGTEYSDTNCQTEVGTWGPDEMTYIIGDKVTASDGLEAFEMDITGGDGITKYVLAKVQHETDLWISDTDGDGLSAATRSQGFSGSGDSIWYKQE